MANDDATAEAQDPPPGLAALDRLVGTWKISGEAHGETTYEWMEGRYFLIQRGKVEREGQTYTYAGFIGYERPPGAEPADAITSRLYTSTGDTLDYTSEIDGNSLTIWFGPMGSPAVYRGAWSRDGNTIEGTWEWPGGGYEETMTRVEP